tara:strand:+ start:84 stop:332 length:249 start_codon:yes stop_codon:yes gene_type:complete
MAALVLIAAAVVYCCGGCLLLCRVKYKARRVTVTSTTAGVALSGAGAQNEQTPPVFDMNPNDAAVAASLSATYVGATSDLQC